MMSRLLDQRRIFFRRKLRAEVRGHMSARLLDRRFALQKVPHLPQGLDRRRIVFFQPVELHIDKQDDFLPVVVKSDNLRKEHEVHILKALAVPVREPQGRLRIFHIIVSKVADQAAGKGREFRNARRAVAIEQRPDFLLRVRRAVHLFSDFNRAVEAADRESRIIAEKAVTPPALLILRRLKEKTVGTLSAQYP